MTKLQQLIRLVEGLDATGPERLAVIEAQHLAHQLETEQS